VSPVPVRGVIDSEKEPFFDDERLGALTSFLAIAPTPVRVFPILFGEAFCEIRGYQ
jgi:hypothetical protein